MTVRIRLTVLLGVLAVAVASCGGSDSAAQTAPGPQLPIQINIMVTNMPVFEQVQL